MKRRLELSSGAAFGLALTLLITLAGCGDNVVARQKAAAEAQKSQAPGEVTAKITSGPANAPETAGNIQAQPSAEEPATEPEKPKSRFHPAAKDADYRYLDKVWETDEEREVIEYLTRAATAEKGYRIVKKNPQKWLPLLRKSIKADHREVRIQTAVILGLLKDKSHETFLSLKDCLLLDSDPDVRAIAAKAFVVLKNKEAVQVLIRSMNEDPYEAARANAAWALGSIGDHDAVEHLRKATRDDDTFVRLRSVSALLKIKSKTAIPELIDRLEDKSPMVRERAHEALRTITGTDKGKDREPWARAFSRPVE
ncbi:MAG TPA: HEAT repeat domain-containing protein [Myxococcota bacterium]|nr:HEAT repeat domain-containing protein [Myxococcota bacterium]